VPACAVDQTYRIGDIFHERATKAGETRFAKQARAAKAHYDARKARLVIELTNGVILMLPPKLLQGLKNATREYPAVGCQGLAWAR
jgi:hypothetical protein